MDLQYPVGKFGWNRAGEGLLATEAERREWLDEIEETPARLWAAVTGLTDAQLDTPYRPGGWTVRQVVHHFADSHMNAYIRFRLALTEKERAEITAAARKQAQAILEEANARGQERQNELVAKAKDEIGKVINSEKEKISREKAETLKAIRQEVADLVILTVEKLLNEKMTSDKDRELIKKLVK